MKNKDIIKVIASSTSILIFLPIRLYLMWYLLKEANASELPMFLFWASVPFALFISILSKVIKANKDD